jgi:uncharacterized protein (DUF427 family)
MQKEMWRIPRAAGTQRRQFVLASCMSETIVPPTVELCAKRLRVVFGNQTIADTANALMVWEHPYYPTYYFPLGDVVADTLVASDHTAVDDALGTAAYSTVRVGSREAVRAAWQYADSPVDQLRGYIRFEWGAMDRWYEESEQVFVHARNPYARLDIIDSNRHVQIEIDGVVVADSVRPKMLFETRLPTRYYLHHDDVRFDLLTSTDTTTPCPYKGTASYWTATVNGREHRNVVWSYQTPTTESAKIAGLMCFYNEKVDVIVDGVRQ